MLKFKTTQIRPEKDIENITYYLNIFWLRRAVAN